MHQVAKLRFAAAVTISTIIGSASWLLLFGILFNNPLSVDVLFIPTAVSVVGAIIIGFLWNKFLPTNILIISLWYSLPYWAWLFFDLASGPSVLSQVLWCSVAMATYISGCAGSVMARRKMFIANTT